MDEFTIRRRSTEDLPSLKRRVKILCYGDSNTWGFSPINGSRFPEDIRWTGVLRRCLGENFTVIEDGLNGRTLGSFGMKGDPLNGSEHLLTLLRAHKHLDLLILYLGINDLFVDPHISVAVMVEELEEVGDNIREVQNSLPVLVLGPLPVNVGREYHDSYHEQIEKSFGLIAEFENVSAQKGCHFLDPSRVISASRHDGVHIEAEEHIKLGLHLCVVVRDLFSGVGSSSRRDSGRYLQ
jgi:lysophospholipase L1-like esterase